MGFSENLGPATVPWSFSHRLSAKAIRQDFHIEIAWPPVPRQEGKRFAVVYVLDGNHAFALSALAARTIQSGPFPLPPTLVVGIGYHFEKPEDASRWGQLRMRDLSPWRDTMHDAQYRNAPPQWRGPRELEQGGADAFLAFIEEEVKPFIAANYPVDENDQTLVGSSLGGLFTLYAMLARPGSFQRYVAISPAIYWAAGALFDLEDRHAREAKDLPAQLFLAAGSLEEAHDVRQKFVSNVYAFEARLKSRDYPSLNLKSRIFDGETHMSVYPGAVTRGLGEVFGGYRDMHDWERWMRE